MPRVSIALKSLNRKVDFFEDQEGTLQGPYLRRTPTYVEKGFYKNGDFHGQRKFFYKEKSETVIEWWQRGNLITREIYQNGKQQSVIIGKKPICSCL